MDDVDRRYSVQPLIQWMKNGSFKKRNMIVPTQVRKVQARVESRTKDEVRWVEVYHQPRSSAILFHDTIPSTCIE